MNIELLCIVLGVIVMIRLSYMFARWIDNDGGDIFGMTCFCSVVWIAFGTLIYCIYVRDVEKNEEKQKFVIQERYEQLTRENDD